MYLGKIKIQNGSKVAVDREAWKRTVKHDKTCKELFAPSKEEDVASLLFL